jgi:membrane-bound ClpP family serine protease
MPEIFGSVAILLGAYAWRMEGPNSRNLGLVVIIAGIICMLVGIYLTSYYGLYDFIPY